MVPGSTIGNTPSNTSGMLRGERNDFGYTPALAGGAVGLAGLGAAALAAPAVAGAGAGLARGLATGDMAGNAAKAYWLWKQLGH